VARNSRREFLKTVGAGSVAATFLSPSTVTAQPRAPLGPGDVPITLTVNGQPHRLTIEPRVTLLDALRTPLDLTGAKRLCDRATCGACTVIIDGRSYYACAMLAIEAQGRNIRTIEGLAQGDVLHPIQQALCDQDGVMCGFCTPGVVMSAVALLERNPAPTPEQARRALDGNVCRCGANVGILKAVVGG
jgi:xanthine dehydrogenase YagT iron-sulfur-binding subunit